MKVSTKNWNTQAIKTTRTKALYNQVESFQNKIVFLFQMVQNIVPCIGKTPITQWYLMLILLCNKIYLIFSAFTIIFSQSNSGYFFFLLWIFFLIVISLFLIYWFLFLMMEFFLHMFRNYMENSRFLNTH